MFINLIKNEIKFLIASKYFLIGPVLFFISVEALLSFSSNINQALLTITSLSLYMLPLITLIIGTNGFYSNKDYISLLISQPLSRNEIYLSKICAYILIISIFYLLGILPSFIIRIDTYSDIISGISYMVLSSIALISFFSCLSVMIGSIINNKLHGILAVIIIWIFYAFVFDFILILILIYFKDYEIQSQILTLTFLNPISLARIQILFYMDNPLILGFSGSIFRSFFDSSTSIILCFIGNTLWTILITLIGLQNFKKKDF